MQSCTGRANRQYHEEGFTAFLVGSADGKLCALAKSRGGDTAGITHLAMVRYIP